MRRRKHANPVDMLFVNPPTPDGFVYIRDINRHGRSSWERVLWPQTSLAYLAAVAESAGLTVDIVDCIAEEIDWPGYLKVLSKVKPRYCLANVISATYHNDIKALKCAKDISQAKTFGMGPHLTNDPETSLMEADGLDFIILREGEETLKELLTTLERSRNLSIKQLTSIKGIAFNPGKIVPDSSKDVVITAPRAFMADLDELPRARHDLLPLDRYWAPFLSHYTFVEASRGCVYRCVFCRQAVMWEWKFRARSAKSLFEEAQYVHSLGVDNILFHADTFTLDHEMVAELCGLLINAGTPFRWACNTHVKPLYNHPELIPKMREAGCWMIAVGIESGDDAVLKNIKKMTTVKEIETVVRMIDRAGIEAWGYFIIGLPGDTLESIEKTIDLALRLPLQIAKFDIAAPYPGTEFHRYVSERGFLKLNSYEEYDQNASAVVDYPNLSSIQIKRAVRQANRRFFFRPRIILRLLREVRDVRTLRSLVKIAIDQVRLLYGPRRESPGKTYEDNSI